LELELTESIVMENGAATHDVLHALKTLGVHLAIDDFGTGYSSLSYLKRLPVDVLQVDKSFVDGLGSDTEDTAIVRAIVSLAHTLNLDVTGEGIETAAQCHDLEVLGCNHGQDYYFAKPQPGDAITALLAAAAPAHHAAPVPVA
jgi:EAL domain-containing protein (putative c-di-GMP-specific phosphodiesterase class I)